MSGTRKAHGIVKQSVKIFLFTLFVFGVSVETVLAKTVDGLVDCNTVVCRSDTSITGASAGATVCGQAALDYAPSCNASKCVDSNGHNSYACVYPVVSTTSTSGGFTSAPSYCGTSTTYSCAQASTSCSSLTPSKAEDPTCQAWCGGTQKYCEVSGGSNTFANTGAQNTTGAAGAGIVFPENTGLPDPPGGVLQILGNFFSWLMAIFGLLAIGAFVISGIQYLIAAGNDDMIKTAKNNMKWSLVGVIVGLSGWVIMQAIGGALSANPFF